MMINKTTFYSTVLFLLTFAFFLESVENSIIPTMEKFEAIENISKNKYSHEQYSKIQWALKQKRNRIRVTSYNMLFNRFDQNLAPENRWPQRLPRIVQLIQEMNPDIIGTQELMPSQVQDLLPYLNETYTFYSRNSDSGEQNGIFYRTRRFSVLRKKIFNMTETPHIHSSSTLTMVQLKDRVTGKTLAVCNAHLAFADIEKRTFQAHFIAEKTRAIASHMPVMFMGDLNTFPNRPDLEALPALDGDYVNSILSRSVLKDARLLSVVGHVGPISTFTNKEGSTAPFEGTGSPGVFLDHIYVSRGITVLLHAVQPGTVDGHFPSDHMPVVIDCVLSGK